MASRICPACGQLEVERGALCGCTTVEKEKATKEAAARKAEKETPVPPYYLNR